MKKTVFNILVIGLQFLIVLVFFVTVFNNDMCSKEHESILKNNNLDKIATSVSVLFAQEKKNENINLIDDVTIEDLPSLNIIVNNDNKVSEKDISKDNINDNESVPLISLDSSKYTSNSSMGFNVTENNKEYSLNGNEFDVVVAVVASEFDKNLNDALGVMSVILNRCDNEKWSRWAGNSPYSQVIRKGQFEVYSSGSYLNYMPKGRNYGSDKYKVAKQAVIDGLNGIRNNDYLGFRAWWVSNYSNKYVIHGGNRYGFN